jgi:Rps23 Pro-64 3,4-dihydroxylase Tpa1-like proline 4-hydroxylase
MQSRIEDPRLIDEVVAGIASPGYIHIPSVLGPEELHAINELFSRRDKDFRPTVYSEKGKTVQNSYVRGDFNFPIDLKNPPAEMVRIVAFFERLQIALNEHLNLNISYFDVNPTRIPPTYGFMKHVDGEDEDHRYLLSLIFYVHQEWGPKDGGALVLYGPDHKPTKQLMPEPGSLFAILGKKFPHEVKMPFRERRTIVSWFHQPPRSK